MKREKSTKWALAALLKQEKEPIGFNAIFEKVQGKSWYCTIKSRTTLSNYLKALQDEKAVKRNTHTRKYSITEHGRKLATMLEISHLILEASPEIRELGIKTLEAINVETRKAIPERKCSEKDVVKTLASWFGATGLHSLLEQIKRGEPFVVVAFYYLGYIGAAYATMKRYIVYKDPEMWLPENLPKLRDRMRLKTGLEKYDVYKPTIEQLEKALEDVFPRETKLLKKLFENEGKQK